MTTTASFNCSRRDSDLIVEIIETAEGLGWLQQRDRMANLMDITACHVNACALDLYAMREALHTGDRASVAHDLGGIRRHIDRETGKLGDCFMPRFAMRIQQKALDAMESDSVDRSENARFV